VTDRAPDFDELVGTDLDALQRERLLRVHELLVEAGPPPELRLGEAAHSTVEPVRLSSRRRRVAVLALAAALGVVVFAAGVLVGDWRSNPGTFRVVTMTGTAYTTGVRATLTIFDADDAGNWPMELEVDGLAPASRGRPYELWLTKGGKLAALCGSFLAEADDTTVVPLNAPYRLKDFDGWVVVAEGSESPLLTT
jgi:hypothetical protein